MEKTEHHRADELLRAGAELTAFEHVNYCLAARED